MPTGPIAGTLLLSGIMSPIHEYDRANQDQTALSQQLLQRSFGLVRFETPRSLTTGIDNVAVTVDHEHPLGPTGVEVVDRIVHRINDNRHGEIQLRAGCLGDALPLVPRCGLIEDHPVVHVRVHLPSVGGMGLLYVDKEECGFVGVRLRQPLQGASLAPKGRSRITSKDQNQGPVFLKFRTCNRRLTIK